MYATSKIFDILAIYADHFEIMHLVKRPFGQKQLTYDMKAHLTALNEWM